jgi:hypothetical protein
MVITSVPGGYSAVEKANLISSLPKKWELILFILTQTYCLQLRGNFMFLPPFFCHSFSDGSIYTASHKAAKVENPQHVAPL